MRQVFPAANAIFTGIGVLLQVSVTLIWHVGVGNAYNFQAVTDASSSQDALIDVFDRIEHFFYRLEAYIKARPTAAMKDIMVKIMVEVLTILGILTDEIGQGRMSMTFKADLSAKVDYCAEKRLKELAGKNDLKEAIQELDKLTEDEARMASIEIWKIAHGTHSRLEDVDEQVEDMHKKIQSLNTKVEDLDVEAQGIDDQVRDLNDKISSVNEGEVYQLTQLIIS